MRIRERTTQRGEKVIELSAFLLVDFGIYHSFYDFNFLTGKIMLVIKKEALLRAIPLFKPLAI